jgi:hypothetical protein
VTVVPRVVVNQRSPVGHTYTHVCNNITIA